MLIVALRRVLRFFSDREMPAKKNASPAAKLIAAGQNFSCNPLSFEIGLLAILCMLALTRLLAGRGGIDVLPFAQFEPHRTL